MRPRFDGLWRHRDFVRLWAGQTISVFGSLTTRVALPFTAVVYLHGRPLQVALVTSSDVLAGICFALFAGVWVDRLRRRPIMIAADLGRAAVLGSIPLAAFFGTLRMEQLYVVAFFAGMLTTFFEVSYQSYVPTLIEPRQLVEGNSKLSGSASVAEFSAFGLAGWLVQLLTAPGAIVVDSLSFLVSAASIRSIRRDEPAPPPVAGRRSMRAEVIEGLRAVGHHAVLRTTAASWVFLSLASGMLSASFLLFTSRQLGFSPGVLGMVFAVGGVTSLFGALSGDWCRVRLGTGGAMMVGLAASGVGIVLLGLAPGASLVGAAFLISQQIITDPGWSIYEINQLSLRQAVAPGRLLGRVNAGVRFAGLLAMLVGALGAGALAGVFSPRVAVFCAAGAAFAAAATIALSPVRRLRTDRVAEDLTTAPAAIPASS